MANRHDAHNPVYQGEVGNGASVLLGADMEDAEHRVHAQHVASHWWVDLMCVQGRVARHKGLADLSREVLRDRCLKELALAHTSLERAAALGDQIVVRVQDARQDEALRVGSVTAGTPGDGKARDRGGRDHKGPCRQKIPGVSYLWAPQPGGVNAIRLDHDVVDVSHQVDSLVDARRATLRRDRNVRNQGWAVIDRAIARLAHPALDGHVGRLFYYYPDSIADAIEVALSIVKTFGSALLAAKAARLRGPARRLLSRPKKLLEPLPLWR
eukprot:scaffold144808_cov112-Phaeocystis_antarctica.AAC.1